MMPSGAFERTLLHRGCGFDRCPAAQPVVMRKVDMGWEHKTFSLRARLQCSLARMTIRSNQRSAASSMP